MPFIDLLQEQFAPSDRVLDKSRFFEKSRELLEQIRAVLGKGTVKLEEQHDCVRLYVRHYRAAVAILAHEEDLDTLGYVVSAYNVHSQQVLGAGKGLALEELGILQVHSDNEEELEQEIEEIRKMQRKITKHRSIKLNDYRDREKVKLMREKPKKAAFFQTAPGMADFYHERYDQ